MSEETKIEEEKVEETNESEVTTEEPVEKQETKTPDPMEDELSQRLAKMKSNMDRMSKERDDALKKAAELEKKEKDAKIKALEEEGKYKEASDLKIKDLEAKLKVYEEENVKLNRDGAVQNILNSFDFRNEKSRQMAFHDIVAQLVQNESKQWVHNSGTFNSLKDFVEDYSKNEDNSFLFKPKLNSGAGTVQANSPTNPVTSDNANKKLSEMTQDEVLKLAAAGKLGSFKY
jgi:hypothetical protein